METPPWTQKEHDACIAAVRRGGMDWPAVAAAVNTRSIAEIQSYLRKFVAQKTDELHAIRNTFEGTNSADTSAAATGSPAKAEPAPASASPRAADSSRLPPVCTAARSSSEDTLAHLEPPDITALEQDLTHRQALAGQDPTIHSPHSRAPVSSYLWPGMASERMAPEEFSPAPGLDSAALRHLAELDDVEAPSDFLQSLLVDPLPDPVLDGADSADGREARSPVSSTPTRDDGPKSCLNSPGRSSKSPGRSPKKHVRIVSDRPEDETTPRKRFQGACRPLTGVMQQTRSREGRPDFGMIYAFIGSIFDPKCARVAHEDVLRHMTPADRRSVLMLVRSLSTSLTSPTVLSALEARVSQQSPKGCPSTAGMPARR